MQQVRIKLRSTLVHVLFHLTSILELKYMRDYLLFIIIYAPHCLALTFGKTRVRYFKGTR